LEELQNTNFNHYDPVCNSCDKDALSIYFSQKQMQKQTLQNEKGYSYTLDSTQISKKIHILVWIKIEEDI